MQPELCQKLIDGNQKSSVKVQPAKGHLTKYRCVCVCLPLTLCGLGDIENKFKFVHPILLFKGH